MRWATFQIPPATTERIGVVRGDEICAMAAGPKLIDLLGDDGERLAAAGAGRSRRPPRWCGSIACGCSPPISRPPAVRDFMTFRQHIEEIRKSQGLELPKQFFEIPVFYFTNPHALIGAHDPVPMPPGCQNLDFECEIGVVIGRDGYNLDPEERRRSRRRLRLFNDWSARDVQRNEMEMRLGPAKGKDTATTLGPWLVTKDEIEPWRRQNGYDLEMVVSGQRPRVRLATSGRTPTGRSARSSPTRPVGTKVCAGDAWGRAPAATAVLAELRARDAATIPVASCRRRDRLRGRASRPHRQPDRRRAAADPAAP